MKFAYADPPYLGCCHLYGHEHGIDGRCWDDPQTHALLIQRLMAEYDGWALSCTSSSLRTLLPFCSADVRVGAWVKSFCAFKRGVRPAYAWEPVIFWGGRNPSAGYPHPPPVKDGVQTTPKDFVIAPITLQRGLTGAKPEAVCFWIFELLNIYTDDDFTDLFPGSGAVGEAWKRYCSRFDFARYELESPGNL